MEGKDERWPARSEDERARTAARDVIARHGEQAADYVLARIEASRTAGQSEDAEAWQQVLEILDESRDEASASGPAMVPPNVA
jgi:hypothetical protein